MIHEVLPDRLTMYVNQAHNIHTKTSLKLKLENITDSVSWFFGITLAKIKTFSAPTSNFRTFQQGCAWDLLSRDRDVQNFVRDETETRRCSFRNTGRDLEAPETLESLGSFNVLPRRFPWHMVKHIDNGKKLYVLINSHRVKRFLFVILCTLFWHK